MNSCLTTAYSGFVCEASDKFGEDLKRGDIIMTTAYGDGGSLYITMIFRGDEAKKAEKECVKETSDTEMPGEPIQRFKCDKRTASNDGWTRAYYAGGKLQFATRTIKKSWKEVCSAFL